MASKHWHDWELHDSKFTSEWTAKTLRYLPIRQWNWFRIWALMFWITLAVLTAWESWNAWF